MSAVFPRDAVVQRYLHTGVRRSRTKIVVTSVFGVLACVVVAAALPAGSSKSGAEKLVPVEHAKSVPALEPAKTVASQAETPPTPPKSDAAATTSTTTSTGAAANQPNAMPVAAIAAALPNPPATPAPVPSPAPPVVVAQTPAPQPAVQAANVPVPPPAAADAATADHAADVAAPEHVGAKLTHKTGHRLTASRRRARMARARATRLAAQPTLVRVVELPDGRRVYQRVRADQAGVNYPGSELRRVFLAPVDRGVD